MKAGRPKKYGSKKALSDAIEGYFRSISRTVPVKDPLGNVILNDEGAEIMMTQYVRPPTVSGLCLYLGIDRSTWGNYCDGTMHPEFAAVTARTRTRIESYLEEQLLTREKNVQGIIFNLQNNYNWRQRQEIGLDKESRQGVRADGLSLEEKLAVIAAAASSAASIQAEEVPSGAENETH